MIYTNLPTTDIKVSKACLGTMSFWAHVSEEAAFQIMDKALELWINFFDTAEVYSVPLSKETYWLTEEIIWRWMKSRNSRSKIVLATKVAGPTRKWHMDHLRWWKNHLDEKNIREAIEWSLRRLQTDYIDLYQLHWPDRYLNTFGQRAFIPQVNEYMTPIEETLKVLWDLQKEWKVRNFWLSNESPWWVMKFLQIAKEMNLPRMVSVQNNYSLLTRTFDNNMAEISLREDIWLLAYSPLWYWVLWWRYVDWDKPTGWRFTVYSDFTWRYMSKKVESIVKKYKTLAEQNRMTLPQMALAFVYSRKFLTSSIIGPSNVSQLIENVEALNIKLSPEVFKAIDEINEECPNVCA